MLTGGECNKTQLLQRKSASGMQSVLAWLLFIRKHKHKLHHRKLVNVKQPYISQANKIKLCQCAGSIRHTQVLGMKHLTVI